MLDIYNPVKLSVNSVNGQTGDVNLTTANIPEVTNLYYTNSRADARITAQKGVANGLAPLNGSGKIDSSYLPATSFPVTSVNGSTGDVILTTSNIAEGSRLYYTQGRFDTAFGLKTTSDLVEGSNLYYTSARFTSDFATKTTDNLAEGSTNQYYTAARAQAVGDARYLQLAGGELTGSLILANAQSITFRRSDNTIVGSLALSVSGGNSGSTLILNASSASSGVIQLQTANSTRLYINQSGYIGIGRTDKVSTLTVQGRANFTGTGTLTNTASATTITGTSTSFGQELGYGDRVTLNGQTVGVTTIPSNTSFTVDPGAAVTNANTNVTFTVDKALFNLYDSSGNGKFAIDSAGRVIVGGSDSYGTAPLNVVSSASGYLSAIKVKNRSGSTNDEVGIDFIVTTSDVQLSRISAQRTNSPSSPNTNMKFYTYGTSLTNKMTIYGNGSIALGTAALATTATDGYPYVPSMAGAPSGTPTTLTGLVPMIVDTTNNKVGFYYGGSWKYATLA